MDTGILNSEHGLTLSEYIFNNQFVVKGDKPNINVLTLMGLGRVTLG
ncbi:hypothetical protein [Arenibacter palladensis]|nr:hypothetical protein [Arenibacter palladensis]MDO6604375.1 hypothetical protein [Arenibacter palladensis]